MTKWEYIRLISKRGTPDGAQGGVLDLLLWSGKPNTAAVTWEEAKTFWERTECPLGSRPDQADDPQQP